MLTSLVQLSGSIPAQTGEPSLALSQPRSDRVYPRTDGGTRLYFVADAREWGLSPHRRGNLPHSARIVQQSGSIPAQTGEPSCADAIPSLLGVYPRTDGGTWETCGTDGHGIGLSPHRRGNPSNVLGRADYAGSIPAQTGEP